MALEGLKLTVSKQKPKLDASAQRRKRLITQVEKQIKFVDQTSQGKSPRGRWWFEDEDGKLILSIKYGRTALELAKGKNAIICEALTDVIVALEKAKAAAVSGSFDDQLATISEQIKRRFGKR
jgi:CTP-dependent riboflavin kinase